MDYYGTLGPSCCLYPVLSRMYGAGMTGIRLNLSHGMLIDQANWLHIAASAAAGAGVRTKIILDLQGPEQRIGKIAGDRVLKSDSDVILGRRGIPVSELLLKQVKKGQHLLLDDGKIEAEIRECNGRQIVARVIRGGVLKSKKSIAVCDMEIESPVLTPQDKENLKIVKQYGITGIMLPFVRGREDILCLRKTLAALNADHIKIMAKIENRAGLDRINEIIESADEVIIARGDLGNAMPLWELPRIQKKIARQCKAAGKPFMIVTQMLDSMEHRPVPTRAEVSDIYNAVLDGASSLMLTGETAVGQYPAEAMDYLVKTAETALADSV